MSPERRAITVIEDDPIMGESLTQSLGLAGYTVDWFQNGADAINALSRCEPDLVVCDIRLPDVSGPGVFHHLIETDRAPPFLFMTAFGDIDQAVTLIRAGAGDYITKPFEMEDFLGRIESLVRKRPPANCVATLGISRKMSGLEGVLKRFVEAGVTKLLVAGETGVGRETIARLFSDLSDTECRPFITVNCAAIPERILASEMFGHEPGVIGDVTEPHIGYLERARDGTLFLSEVEALAPQMQAALLRLIEEGAFCRLGGERPIAFEARLVCSCGEGLEEAVARQEFREDLYLAISTAKIVVPPLRERSDDIAWLMEGCLRECANRVSTELRGITASAEEAAFAHDWPGNVRELRNRVERAAYLTLNGWIMPHDLFPERGRRTWPVENEIGSLARVREVAEKRQIERALAYHDGQIAKAAHTLGISRTTLWDKMRRYGLKIDD